MLTAERSQQHPKRTLKINSIETQSTQLLKKRSYSMRKLHKVKPILNFGHGLSEHLKNIGATQEKQKQINTLTQRIEIESPIKAKYGIMSSSKLSPIKQYQTKLKISAESWLVYDYRRDSYKRGWRPAEIQEYSGMTRLLVLKVFTDFYKQNPELKNFNIRVNALYLKQQVQMEKQQKLPASKRKGIIIRQSMSRGLENNIMINMLDLLYGLFLTNYDDLLEYAIIFTGYLCYCHTNKINPISEDSPCHFIDKVPEACANAEHFSHYTSQILFPQLQMGSSYFKADTYTFQTCANDICRLYLSLQDLPLFKQIISCKELTCKTKYQIGFRYWENRTLVFKNRRIDMGSNYSFVGNWKGKKNYGVISRNQSLNILVILQDCKYGMAECDILNIQSWVKQLMKPVVDLRKTHVKLLPLLRVGRSKSPPKKNSDSHRTITEVNQKE